MTIKRNGLLHACVGLAVLSGMMCFSLSFLEYGTGRIINFVFLCTRTQNGQIIIISEQSEQGRGAQHKHCTAMNIHTITPRSNCPKTARVRLEWRPMANCCCSAARTTIFPSSRPWRLAGPRWKDPWPWHQSYHWIQSCPVCFQYCDWRYSRAS